MGHQRDDPGIGQIEVAVKDPNCIKDMIHPGALAP